MRSTPGVESNLGWALGVVTRAYLSAVGEAVADVPGGVRGYLVLVAAGRGEPRSQLALAQHLGVDRTAMTYLLDELEERGLIERRPDPADRRARRVTVTASGRARLQELEAGMGRIEARLLEPLHDVECDVLRDVLRRLATHLAPADPCGPPDPCSLGPTVPKTVVRRGRAVPGGTPDRPAPV